MAKTRLVVLGASGFVGSQACAVARIRQLPVVPISSVDLDLLRKGSPEKLRTLLRDGDVVVHSAAIAPARHSRDVTRNLEMTQNIIDALRESPISKLIVVSSDAVYPDESSVLTESSAAAPDSLHGIMSLGREQICQTLDSAATAVLRLAPVYGAKDPHGSYGPNRFLREAMDSNEITIFGSGSAKRDHVSIQDVAEAIVNVATTETIGTFNIASGTSLSFMETAEIVAREFPGCAVVEKGQESKPTFRFFDITEYLRLIALQPPLSPEIGLRRLAQTAA